jgi:hypothetical protein
MHKYFIELPCGYMYILMHPEGKHISFACFRNLNGILFYPYSWDHFILCLFTIFKQRLGNLNIPPKKYYKIFVCLPNWSRYWQPSLWHKLSVVLSKYYSTNIINHDINKYLYKIIKNKYLKTFRKQTKHFVSSLIIFFLEFLSAC